MPFYRTLPRTQHEIPMPDLIDIPADVSVTPHEVTVKFHRRSHLPILAASGLLDQSVVVPWWAGARLTLSV